MEKNVAGKWIVFAYGLPDHASDGQPITGDAANITANIRIDGGAANAVDDTNPTELEDGYYVFDITAVESNGDLLSLHPASSTANVQVIGVPGAVWTRPPNFNDLSVTSSTGRVDIDSIAGTAQTANDNGADINAILIDTAEIGTNGDGLTAIPWNSAWDAEVESEVTDGLTAMFTSSAQLVDDVWDEVLTGGTHNVTNSSGRRLRQLEASFVVAAGTAQAGSTNTITLAAGEPSTDDIFEGDRVIIVGGTGVGEHGLITTYNGTTKVATMSKNWIITPDNTSEYELTPADCDIETWNHNGVTGDGDWAELQTDVDAVLVDTNELQTNQGNWLTATGFATSAALATVDGIVDAILVDTNDLQTNQGNWLTVTGFATEAKQDTIDGVVDSVLVDTTAIKAKTVQMAFTKSNELDVNTRSINSATVIGDGNAIPWDGA